MILMLVGYARASSPHRSWLFELQIDRIQHGTQAHWMVPLVAGVQVH